VWGKIFKDIKDISIMDYQKTIYRKENQKEKLKVWHKDSFEFSLKALDNQEFMMPAVCH